MIVSPNGWWPWESRNVTTADLQGIAFGNGRFVVIGSYWSGAMADDTVILTSTDASAFQLLSRRLPDPSKTAS